MTSREIVLEAMRAQGKTDAINLRNQADGMTGTEIIKKEQAVPIFDGNKDYSEWSVGAPVKELIEGEYQVFKLITPHHASHYIGTPNTLRSLWSLCHTTDPLKAKPYLPPNGTSGLWKIDECCTDVGHVWRNLYDNNDFPPSALPDRWEDLGTIEEVQYAVHA